MEVTTTYLPRIQNWRDPCPEPVVEQYKIKNGIGFVIRDDLLKGGSKERFVDYLIKTSRQKEIVFGGCPATGYAQMALPLICKKHDNSDLNLFIIAEFLIRHH